MTELAIALPIPRPLGTPWPPSPVTEPSLPRPNLEQGALVLQGVYAKVFDLSKPEDQTAFSALKLRLAQEQGQNLVKLMKDERRFAHGPPPTWLAYLEWHEFVFTVRGIKLTRAQYDRYRITGQIPDEAIASP